MKSGHLHMFGNDFINSKTSFEKPFLSYFRSKPEQLHKSFVSWVSSGEYLMIDFFWEDAFGAFCPFAEIFHSEMLGCRQPSTDCVVCDNFLTVGVLELTFRIVDLLKYCVCCERSGVIQCTLSVVFYLLDLYHCVLQAMLRSLVGFLMLFLATEPSITAGLLIPFQFPSGTILGTLYTMVWNWKVLRAGPMFFFIGPSCPLPFCLLLFSRHHLSFYWLVLCGWGLRTNRVWIVLSRDCIADLP